MRAYDFGDRKFSDAYVIGFLKSRPINFTIGTERELARQIVEAKRWVAYANKRAQAENTNESACRLHYCEQWLASLMAVARALP